MNGNSSPHMQVCWTCGFLPVEGDIVKDGLRVGVEACVKDLITEDMQPSFAGGIVHPVYGTAAMVYHMEWAARSVILPYLEDAEEGISTGVEVRHLHPAPVGAVVEARALCTSFVHCTVTCQVQVWHSEQLLGEGQVEQRIVLRKTLHQRFPDLWSSTMHGDISK